MNKADSIKAHTPIPEIPVVFTDEFMKSNEKRTQWSAFLKRIGNNSELRFEDVMLAVRKFLKPVYDTIMQGQMFVEKWDCKTGEW